MTTTSRKASAKGKTFSYDAAEHPRTPEKMAANLDAWVEEAPDDISGIARALGDIARAKGLSQVAKEAGLSRERLYRALSDDGNPSSRPFSRSRGPWVCYCMRRRPNLRARWRPSLRSG